MDKEFFVREIEAYGDVMYRVAFTILGNDDACKDALQEAALKAWEKRHTLREERYFKTWITRILINGCYDIRLKCRENTTLNKARERLELSVLDGEGNPFPQSISFTGEFLDEKGEKFPMDDPESLVIPGFIYRTMITVEELPHSLLITDGQVVKVK